MNSMGKSERVRLIILFVQIETGSAKIQRKNDASDVSTITVTLKRSVKADELPSAQELTLNALCDK